MRLSEYGLSHLWGVQSGHGHERQFSLQNALMHIIKLESRRKSHNRVVNRFIYSYYNGLFIQFRCRVYWLQNIIEVQNRNYGLYGRNVPIKNINTLFPKSLGPYTIKFES